MAQTSNSPDFSDTYSLFEAGGERQFRATLEISEAHAWSLLTGAIEQSEPIAARWIAGSGGPGELIWTNAFYPVLISDKVRALFQERGLSGWGVVPVDLRGKDGEAIPNYYFLCFTGRCGPLSYEGGKEVEKVMPGGVFIYRRGLSFDPTTWDGSDMFMASGKGHRLFLRSAMDALRSLSSRNTSFMALSQVETRIGRKA